MSEKRRDKKKRILRNGESQRKDGRYAYKYYDNAGNVQFVYSWKLEKGDRLPAGKRDDLALREKERAPHGGVPRAARGMRAAAGCLADARDGIRVFRR